MSAAAGIGERRSRALRRRARRRNYRSRWRRWRGSPTTTAGLGTRAARRCSAPSIRRRWALCGHNPVRLLQEASIAGLSAAAADSSLCARASELEGVLQEELAAPASEGFTEPHRPIAFLCAEHGIPPVAPSTRAASARSPATSSRRPPTDAWRSSASGSSTTRATFASASRRRLASTSTGRTPTASVPAALVTGADGEPLPSRSRSAPAMVAVQIWRVDAGRVPLYLLDCDLAENSRTARWIATRLYVSDPDLRLAQYLLLGVGGMRALRGARHRIRPSCISTRATRPSPRSSSPRQGAGAEGRRARRLAWEAAGRAACPLHHAHSGARRQRHLPARGAGARRAARFAAEAGSRRRQARLASAAPRAPTRTRRSASPSSRSPQPPPSATGSAAVTARSPGRCGAGCGRS